MTGWGAVLVSVAFMFAVFGQIPINDVLIGRVTRSEWRSGWSDPIPSEPIVSLDWNDGRVEVRTVRNESGWVIVAWGPE